MNGLPRIISIVGTNASGKSGLGVELASRFGGEIVSADSRQVFSGLDLGSGKIAPGEMRGVPHHLLDVAKPGEFFSMADFQRLAYEAIDGILARGRLPFLVGGTGLYVDCVLKGYVLSDVPPDLAYREELERMTTPQLASLLREKLPEAEVDEKNRNRVMRMLEKLHDGDLGHAPCAPRYDALKMGVTWPRPELCRRIDERLARRMAQGMAQEVQGLMDAGVDRAFLDKLGLEYRYISRYLAGEISSQAEMLDELARAIKRFAKRQMIWFRREKDIAWLDMADNPADRAEELIRAFLAR